MCVWGLGGGGGYKGGGGGWYWSITCIARLNRNVSPVNLSETARELMYMFVTYS